MTYTHGRRAAGLRPADRMGREEARRRLEAVKACLDSMGSARAHLLELERREGWRAVGYSSWRECVEKEFTGSRSYLYRQLAAAKSEEVLSPTGEFGHIPESVLRPLGALRREPEAMRGVWDDAVADSDGNVPTGELVARLVRERQRAMEGLSPEHRALLVGREEQAALGRGAQRRERDRLEEFADALLRAHQRFRQGLSNLVFVREAPEGVRPPILEEAIRLAKKLMMLLEPEE